MANSAVFLCSAFLQVNYQGLAGNYPTITQCSGELPVIYLTANNTKSRTRQELRNRTSCGTCKWKKNAVTAAGAQGSSWGCWPEMGTRMSPRAALHLHVEERCCSPPTADSVRGVAECDGNVKGWWTHGAVPGWPGRELRAAAWEENPAFSVPGELWDSGMVGRRRAGRQQSQG